MEIKTAEEQLGEATKNARDEIAAKIAALGPSELAAFSWCWQGLKSSDDYKQSREAFLKQFDDFNPVYRPHYYFNDVENSIKKEVGLRSSQRLELVEALRRHVNDVKQQRDIVAKRVSTPENLKKYRAELETFVKNGSLDLYESECAIASLQSSNEISVSLPQLVIALKSEFGRSRREFPLKAFHRALKLFPIVKRREVIELALGRFVSDVKDSVAPLPQYPDTEEALAGELARLSRVLSVDMDINLHDGQQFFYLCDRLFTDTFREPLEVPKYEEVDLLDDYAEMRRIVDVYLVKHGVKDRLAESMLEQFSVLPMEEMNTILSIVTARRLDANSLSRDRTTIMLKLEFVRNKQLFAACIQKVKEIAEIRKCLCPNEDSDYVTVTMSWIRMYAIAVLSKSFTTLPSTVNKERVFEEFMFDMSEYLDAKLDILKSLNTIMSHTQSDTVSKTALSLIDHFPSMNSAHFTFHYPFRMAVDELKVEATVLKTFIEMQSVHERHVSNEIPDSFVDVSFLSDEMISSHFRVLRAVGLIGKFLERVPHVALEINDSFSMKWIRMETYLKWAVWTQLLNEMRGFQENPVFPYDYLAIGSYAGVADSIGDFLVSPYLTSWQDINDLIESAEEGQKTKIGLACLKFLSLSSKLKRYLYSTRYLQAVYCQQRRMSPLNVEPMSDVLSFVRELDLFSSVEGTRESIRSGELENLRKAVDAQRRFNIMLTVAIRFNNFYCDANLLSSQFGVTENFVPYQSITGVNFEDDMAARRFAVSQVVTGIDKVNEAGLSKLFCNIRDVTDCNNIQKIQCAVLPFAYRVELAMICQLEAQLFSEVSTSKDFLIRTGDVFITDNGEIVPNVIPDALYCLSLDKEPEVLEPVIKFAAARLNLLHLLRMESVANMRFSKVIEGISGENLPCDLVTLTSMNKEVTSDKGSGDVHLVGLAYLHKEEYLANRMLRACLCVLDDVYDVTDQRKKRRFLESESEKSLKRFWRSLNKMFWSHSKALTSKRYIPDVYNQLLFQCDDFTRAEVQGEFQNQDGVVHDALRNIESDDITRTTCDFMNNLLKCSVMKRVFMLMYDEANVEELNVTTAVLNVTEEIWKKGEVAHENDINVRATQRLGNITKEVSVEMKHHIEMRRAYLNQLDGFLCEFQLGRFKDSLSKALAELSDAVAAPNAMLKPEVYKRAAKGTKRRREIYNPAPKDSDKQFRQEIQFAMSRIIYDAREKVDSFAAKDTNYVVCDRNALMDKLKDTAAMLDGVVRENQYLIGTWNGYLEHAMDSLDDELDSHIILNRFAKDLYSNLESQVTYELTTKMQEDFFKLNTLRYLEKVMKLSQRREELQMTKEIKEDFEDLIADLQCDIESAKNDYREAHKKWFGTAIRQVEALQKEPDELKQILATKRLKTHGEKLNKIEKDKKDLATQIMKMRISRCLERMGSTIYYTRQIARVAEEKKSLSATLWSGRREFEEVQRSLTHEVEECFQKLTDAELEIEDLTQKLEQEKYHTAQLLHWRGMSLKSYSLMVEQEKELEPAGDVNISQLLERLAAAHDELDQLVAETDAFDEEFTFQVREPMAERDRCYRRLVRLSAQNAADTEKLKLLTEHTPAESPFLTHLLADNEALKVENDELRNKIQELELAKSEMTPDAIHSLDGLFDPAPKPPPFPRRTVAFSTKPPLRIVKPNRNSVRGSIPKITLTTRIPETARF